MLSQVAQLSIQSQACLICALKNALKKNSLYLCNVDCVSPTMQCKLITAFKIKKLMTIRILVQISSSSARWTIRLISFLSLNPQPFSSVVPCIKTFHHGTSMQCLHQATLKYTYKRFNQSPFIKSVFSAHVGGKKAPAENSKEKEGCFAKLSA